MTPPPRRVIIRPLKQPRYAFYDLADLQRPTIAQARHIVNWIQADTEDGNRGKIFSSIDVVGILLRNTIVGKITRGLVKLINRLLNPPQPNQICISLAEIEEFFAGAAVSTRTFTETPPPNAPVRGLNQTSGPIPGKE